MEQVLNAILASESPTTILLTIVLITAFIVFGRAINSIVPLVANLVTTLHELSERIGDQLDVLKQIDDGTKERTAKGISVILEHSERAFTALRKQADDNHAATLQAIERLRLDVALQLSNQRMVISERDKES